MKNYPILQTERLLLNQPVVADIPRIVEYAGHAEIAAMTQNIPHPYTEADAVFWLNLANTGWSNGQRYIFAIREREGGPLLGGIGLNRPSVMHRATLGYWLARPYWNRGYVTEALHAVLKFGFGLQDLNKIYATHLIHNPASGRVMQKAGMIFEGELKDHFKKGDEYRTVRQYRLTRAEYLAQANK